MAEWVAKVFQGIRGDISLDDGWNSEWFQLFARGERSKVLDFEYK